MLCTLKHSLMLFDLVSKHNTTGGCISRIFIPYSWNSIFNQCWLNANVLNSGFCDGNILLTLYISLTFFSVSLVCRSDVHGSILNFLPGDTHHQPVSDGRTCCRDILLMSSQMKFTIISGQLSHTRRKGWIRATAWESAPTALLTQLEWKLSAAVSQRATFVPQTDDLYVHSVLTLVQTVLTKLYELWLPVSPAAWIIVNTASSLINETRINVLNFNEKCQGWCLKSALWALFSCKNQKEHVLWSLFIFEILYIVLLEVIVDVVFKCHL